MTNGNFNIETFADEQGNTFVKEQTFRLILEAAAKLIEDQRVALRTHDKAKQQDCMAREDRLLQIWEGYKQLRFNNEKTQQP